MLLVGQHEGICSHSVMAVPKSLLSGTGLTWSNLTWSNSGEMVRLNEKQVCACGYCGYCLFIMVGIAGLGLSFSLDVFKVLFASPKTVI